MRDVSDRAWYGVCVWQTGERKGGMENARDEQQEVFLARL